MKTTTCDACGKMVSHDRSIRLVANCEGKEIFIMLKPWNSNPKIQTDLCLPCMQRIAASGKVSDWMPDEKAKYGR